MQNWNKGFKNEYMRGNFPIITFTNWNHVDKWNDDLCCCQSKNTTSCGIFLDQIPMLKQTTVLEVIWSIKSFKYLKISLERMCKTIFQMKKARKKSQLIHFQRMSKKRGGRRDLITANNMTWGGHFTPLQVN